LATIEISHIVRVLDAKEHRKNILKEMEILTLPDELKLLCIDYETLEIRFGPWIKGVQRLDNIEVLRDLCTRFKTLDDEARTTYSEISMWSAC